MPMDIWRNHINSSPEGKDMVKWLLNFIELFLCYAAVSVGK